MGLPANSPQREHRKALQIPQRPAEGTAANSPGKAVIIKRASPGWEEALFIIIGFALPCLLLAEEERDRRQQQEAGVTGVAAAATAAAGFCLSCGQDYDIVREKRLRLVYSK